MRTFTKIGSDGQNLPADATEFVAVRDDATQLVWTVEEPKPMSWKKAKAYAEKLDLCGWSWRLPTVEELFCLANRSKFDPAIDTAAFPGCKGGVYWSGTVDASSPSVYAWCVFFSYGNSDWFRQDYEGRVRAVRASQ